MMVYLFHFGPTYLGACLHESRVLKHWVQHNGPIALAAAYCIHNLLSHNTHSRRRAHIHIHNLLWECS